MGYCKIYTPYGAAYERTSIYVQVGSVIYEHATHFVFPESMLKTMPPIGSGIFMKLAFQAARKYPKECQRARLDIDQRVRNAVAEWNSAER